VIIAIPVRDASSNEQLRYALRAWQIALPDAQPVVIGGRPSWYQGNHIPTNQQRGRDSQWRVNFPLALRAIIDSGLVREDEPFIWTADDIFPLSKGAIRFQTRTISIAGQRGVASWTCRFTSNAGKPSA